MAGGPHGVGREGDAGKRQDPQRPRRMPAGRGWRRAVAGEGAGVPVAVWGWRARAVRIAATSMNSAPTPETTSTTGSPSICIPVTPSTRRAIARSAK